MKDVKQLKQDLEDKLRNIKKDVKYLLPQIRTSTKYLDTYFIKRKEWLNMIPFLFKVIEKGKKNFSESIGPYPGYCSLDNVNSTLNLYSMSMSLDLDLKFLSNLANLCRNSLKEEYITKEIDLKQIREKDYLENQKPIHVCEMPYCAAYYQLFKTNKPGIILIREEGYDGMSFEFTSYYLAKLDNEHMEKFLDQCNVNNFFGNIFYPGNYIRDTAKIHTIADKGDQKSFVDDKGKKKYFHFSPLEYLH